MGWNDLQKTLNETGKEWKRLLGRSRSTYSDSSSSDDDDEEDEKEEEAKAEDAKEEHPNGAPKTEATQPAKQELKTSGAATAKDEAKQGDNNTGKRKRVADDPADDKTAKTKKVDNVKGNGSKADTSTAVTSATPTGTYTYPISPAERPKQCEQEVRNILSKLGPMTTKVFALHLGTCLCTLHAYDLLASLYLSYLS